MKTLADVISTAKKSGKTERDVARYLFIWMGSEIVIRDYNSAIESFTKFEVMRSGSDSGSKDSEVPIDVFILGVQIGRTSYSSAYGRLCSLAGIECRQVCGSLRGVGLRSTTHSSFDKRKQSVTQAMMTAHTWSIITLNADNSKHQLLVCCQCAVQRAAPIESNLKQQSSDVLVNDFESEAVVDCFYFGTNPDIFVYSHFPTETPAIGGDSKPKASDYFQLLETPLDQTQFFLSPLVTSAFYSLNLDFEKSTKTSNIVVSSPSDHKLILEWKNRDEAIKAAEFRDFRFLFVATDPMTGEKLKEEDMSPELKALGGSLADYCILEISECSLSFTLRFPENGTYRFVSFASGNQQIEAAPEQPRRRQRKSSSYLLPPSSSLVPLCEWTIEVDRAPMKDRPMPFPKCQASQIWGIPVGLKNRFGIVNSLGNFGARIETDENGIAEIAFKITRPCIFSTKLKYLNKANPSGASVFHRIVKKTTIFTISIPLDEEPTEMGLEIFANDPSCDGKTLYGFAQFLVVAPVKPKTEVEPCFRQLLMYPAMSSNLLGQHSAAVDVGLKAKTHPDPLIAVNSSKELELRFSTSDKQPLRMIVALYLAKSIGPNFTQNLQDVSIYTMHETIDSNTMAVYCRFPQKGVYKLQLFAAKQNSQTDLPVVFTYAIFVNAKSAPCSPFPKQLAAWNGGRLIEPRHGILEANAKTSNFSFRLTLPTARKVAIVIRSTPKERIVMLNQIQKTDGSSHWEGVVNLENYVRIEVALIANLLSETDEASYSTLLIFNSNEMFL